MATRHLTDQALGRGLRLALVGYGRVAARHLEVFRALGCDVSAACNRSARGRLQAEREGGIARTYGNIAEMLEKEKPDGVVCCASFSKMFKAACEILPARIPVLLEKPPATSLDELEALCEMQRRHGTPVQVALNRRHYSVLHSALAEGGGRDAVTAVFVSWSEDPRSFLKRGFPEEEVAKLIFANSLHGLDLLTHIAGPLVAPAVHTQNLGPPFRWNMCLSGISDRGALASFTSTWDSPGSWRLTVCFPGKRYTFAPLESCIEHREGTRETRQLQPALWDQDFKPGFYQQARSFLKLVRRGEAPEACHLRSVEPAMYLAEELTRRINDEYP